MKLLNSLNDAQAEAVKYNSKPHMIVAGAGSGKTRALTYKVAYIIEQEGYDPSTILALTFTNKAANEMKERIVKLVGKKAAKMWIGTFHSIFARILRKEAEKLNYRPNFSIYDKEDSVTLVNHLLNEYNISIDGYTPNSIHHKISYLKNTMVEPDDYLENFAQTAAERKIGQVYQEYNKHLFANNAMDFDDLLLKPIKLFQSNEKILRKYRKEFKYILVD